MKEDPTVVAITSGTPTVMGFTEDKRQEAGKQFVDVGIAEETAVALASGIAANGGKPVYGVYSTFVQRTYDQISQDPVSYTHLMIFYYLIVLLVILSLNFIVLPIFTEHQVKEVDYSKFMQMINKKEIGSVNIESNQIIFTDKDETHIYKTGVIEDPQLVDRLYDSGAKFSSEIIKETSPFTNLLVGFILPMVIFVGLGQLMAKRLSSCLLYTSRCV